MTVNVEGPQRQQFRDGMQYLAHLGNPEVRESGIVIDNEIVGIDTIGVAMLGLFEFQDPVELESLLVPPLYETALSYLIYAAGHGLFDNYINGATIKSPHSKRKEQINTFWVYYLCPYGAPEIKDFLGLPHKQTVNGQVRTVSEAIWKETDGQTKKHFNFENPLRGGKIKSSFIRDIKTGQIQVGEDIDLGTLTDAEKRRNYVRRTGAEERAVERNERRRAAGNWTYQERKVRICRAEGDKLRELLDGFTEGDIKKSRKDPTSPIATLMSIVGPPGQRGFDEAIERLRAHGIVVGRTVDRNSPIVLKTQTGDIQEILGRSK